MATRHIHVFKRNSIYWWRRRVPSALRAAFGRPHLARSLRTADPAEARRRARRLSSRIDDLFARLEHAMTQSAAAPTPDQIDAVLNALYKQVIADGDRKRRERHAPEAEELFTRALRVGIRAHKDNIERELGEFREDEQIGADARPPAIRSAARSVAASENAIKTLLRRAGLIADDGDAPMLSALFERYVRAKTGKLSPEERRDLNIREDEEIGESDEDLWHASHELDARTAWKLWEQLVGDCRVDQNLADKAWEFRRKLAWVPVLHGRSVFAGLMVKEAIASASRATPKGQFDSAVPGPSNGCSALAWRGAQRKRWATTVWLRSLLAPTKASARFRALSLPFWWL